MNALTLVFVSLCIFAIAYRFYGLFIANKVLGLRRDRPTPADTCADSIDYVKTNKFVLFGHHFAAIAAAGPLLGPVLAAQFGFLPGALWIIIGCVLGGGVHDMVVLFASTRHKGQSLAKIAESEVSKTVGIVASFAFLFILILTLAGLSIAVLNALFESFWGVFVVGSTIPIAIFMGVWMSKIRPGDVKTASIFGVALLAAAIYIGGAIEPTSTLAQYLKLSKHQIAIAIPLYAFIASVLPVWFLTGAARLSVNLSEDSNRPHAGDRHLFCASRTQDAGAHAVYGWRRPRHPRQCLPLRLYHHSLRCHIRFSRHHCNGNNAKNARQ